MGKRVPIPDMAELEPGKPRLVIHGSVPYCVVKTDTAEVRGFVAACSHKARAIVPLRCKNGQIVCPHHGARFDATTGEVVDARGNDVPTGLERVDVVSEGGAMLLHTRNRHRKLLRKKERKRVAKLDSDH